MMGSLKHLLFSLALLLLCGCTGNSSFPGVAETEYPEVDPDDPNTIPRWENSEFNVFDSKIKVVELQFLHGFLGNSAKKQPASVGLEAIEAKQDGISPEQHAAIDYLVANEEAIYDSIRTEVYEEYKRSYPTYREAWELGMKMFGGSAEDIEENLPVIRKGDELDGLVEFAAIHIHPPVDGVSTIGIEFGVPWDGENGMGLLLEEGKVVSIGIDDEALDTKSMKIFQ